MKIIRILLPIVLAVCFSCKHEVPVVPDTKETVGTETSQGAIVTGYEAGKIASGAGEKPEAEKEKISILVIQCSNGYGYSALGYNFNPVIEQELKKFADFEVLGFSYKKLMGVAYQGVYDKKYAKEIMEKVDADIFIMTRFAADMHELPQELDDWGYELKLLNTRTLEQKVSIGSDSMKNYPELEENIIENVDKLAEDIRIIAAERNNNAD